MVSADFVTTPAYLANSRDGLARHTPVILTCAECGGHSQNYDTVIAQCAIAKECEFAASEANTTCDNPESWEKRNVRRGGFRYGCDLVAGPNVRHPG